MKELYIGLISGTSVDGIDTALIDFSQPQGKLLAAANHAIPTDLQTRLLAFNKQAEYELDNYAVCDVQLGKLFAQSVLALLATTSYSANDILAIGSHGQTIRHYPGGNTPTTLQIGDPNIIAELTGITTVADFRRRDMAAGGQGAPLVPAFHAEVFRDQHEDRAILNLGGIANLTLLPADPHQAVTGFDTGPANCLLNDWIKHCQQLEYDHAGQWAASGQCQQSLLSSFLSDPYFSATPPKTTGRDYFRLEWIQKYTGDTTTLNAVDIQSSLMELTVQSIANDLRRYAPRTRRLLICGGGIHNQELIKRLQSCLTEIEISSTATFGVDPDFLEATAFAWLARQTLAHKPGSLSSVTGARHGSVLGGIYPA